MEVAIDGGGKRDEAQALRAAIFDSADEPSPNSVGARDLNSRAPMLRTPPFAVYSVGAGDHQVNFGALLDGEVSRLRALEDVSGIDPARHFRSSSDR